MQKEFNVVVTDTSCFIILEKIGLLHILDALFGKVYTTPQIANEYGNELPVWVIVKDIAHPAALDKFKEFVDLGEASAIALALEINSDFIIIDDAEARRYAEGIGLNVKGSMGLLVSAKQNHLIPALKPFLEVIEQTNFRVSKKLIQSLLRDVGE